MTHRDAAGFFAALLVTVFATPGLAQERTGPLLGELVAGTTAGMNALDRKVSVWGAEDARRQRKVERKYEAWDRETEGALKGVLGGQFREALAELNVWNRRQVDVAIEDLRGLLSRVEALRGSVAARRDLRLGRVARSAAVRDFNAVAANLIRDLTSRLEDPEMAASLGLLESQLVTLDELLGDELGPERSIRAMDDAFRALESLYVSLVQLRAALDAERVRYAAGALRTQARELSTVLRERLGSRFPSSLATAPAGRRAARSAPDPERRRVDRPRSRIRVVSRERALAYAGRPVYATPFGGVRRWTRRCPPWASFEHWPGPAPPPCARRPLVRGRRRIQAAVPAARLSTETVCRPRSRASTQARSARAAGATPATWRSGRRALSYVASGRRGLVPLACGSSSPGR